MAAVLITGCSSSYSTAYDPSTAYEVFDTPDADGMLVFTLSASDTLGRHLYHDEFQNTQLVAIQVEDPGWNYAEGDSPETSEVIVDVPTPYEE
ncbi:MAG: hypothetical protein CMJ49_03160 [Planctomycetaceae bacterium]|nr:hypothetical protein [Planctomycetaceae bacterium]